MGDLTGSSGVEPEEVHAVSKRNLGLTRANVLLFFVLLVFWFLFSGAIDIGRILVGVFLAGGLTILWQLAMHSIVARQKPLGARGTLNLLRFLARMHWEVFVANLKMLAFTWRPRLALHPEFVTLELRVENPVLRVLIANAITMTPGTLSVLLEEKRLLVHCIDRSLAVDLPQSPLVVSIERVEGGDS